MCLNHVILTYIYIGKGYKMTKKLITNIIGLALISTTMTYASTSTETFSVETKTNGKNCVTEKCISTPTLQKEVEKLSIEGKLPFEMGLELMKRWTNDKVS